MLTVSTFNIQNNYFKYDIFKANTIINYLKDNKIDVLNLQEVYTKLDRDITRGLNKINYKMVGKYRGRSKIVFRPFNESTPIITNREIIDIDNYRLPFLPSVQKRIMTRIVIRYNKELVSIYNTHLDYKFNSVKERELNRIYEIISKDKNKIILTGDFNLKINNNILLNFIDKLKKLNIIRIPLDEKTLKWSRYNRAIDHIFISDSFKVIEKEVVKDLDISDHYPLLIKLK